MKRTGRRFTEDFLEENNEEIVYEDFELADEVKQNAPAEEEFQYFDFSNEDFDNGEEIVAEEDEKTDKKSRASIILIKIAKVLLVILVLVALFFTSAKITEIILDRNEEPVSYGNDAPDFEEDFDEIIDEDTNIVEEEIPEVLGNEEIEEPEPEKKPEADKPEADKPETQKPEAEKPAPQPEPTPEPEPAPTPSPAPKPSIKPGNPAA